MAKEMTEAKRKMAEQQQKIALDVQKREKAEFLAAKQRALEELKRDREERFGKKATAADEPVKAAPVKKEMEPFEMV